MSTVMVFAFAFAFYIWLRHGVFHRQVLRPDFRDCVKFQQLQRDIRTHILNSPRTLEAYNIYIFTGFHNTPYAGRILCVHSIAQHFLSHWPSFWPLDIKKYHEGIEARHQIRYTEDANNEVHLNPALVRAVEDTSEGSELSIYLKTVLISTIFHELTNRLTPLIFRSSRRSGCGNHWYSSDPPDPGSNIETFLFGGLILVLWRSEDIGDMTKVKGLVLLHENQSRVLTLEHCRLLIDSITTTDLVQFTFSQLDVYEPQAGIGQYRAQTLFPLNIHK